MNIFAAIKARLFPGWGGMPSFAVGASDWVRYHGNYPGVNIDYAAVAGELWKNSVVMACIGWTQRAFPEADLQVVALDGKEENPVENHPLITLMDQPNPFTTGDQFWQAALWDLELTGNAYAVKIRSGGGTLLEVWNMPCHRITPLWNNSGNEFIGGYRLQVEGSDQRLPPEDVIHFKVGKDPQNERLGYSPFASCLREVSILNEATNYCSAILRNGAVASHFVSAKERGTMTADQARAMEALWLNKVTGQGRGRPIFSSLPADVIRLDYSPADLALGQMTDEHANAICAADGVPAMLLGITAGEAHRTYSNYGEARAAGMTEKIVPLQKLLAETLTHQLLRLDFGGKENERCCFDVTQIKSLQEDENARWGRYVEAWKAGAITRAGLKVALGMDADEAVDNVYFIPSLGALVPADETPEDREAAAEEVQAQMQQQMQQLPPATGEGPPQEEEAAPAGKALPVPTLVQISPLELDEAEALFDEVMGPKFAGILSASTINGKG